MKGSEFLKKIQKLAKEKSVVCSWHPEKGKGSHGILKYGERRTTLRNLKDELKTGTYHGMLKQLGLTERDFT
jgi:mRNA interferase HicA